MKKYIAGWIILKTCMFALVWVFLFSGNTPYLLKSERPTPTPTPKVDDSIDRPTSDPYTGDLARFDREGRAEKLEIERVMDILGIEDGSAVADIGAGGGWFSVIASKRVGPTGKVYAVDISEDSVEFINKRKQKEDLPNIVAVLGKPSDPLLPENEVNAVLILNTYHEIAEPVVFLKNLVKSLKKGALVGVIDRVGKGDDHGIDSEVVKEEARRAGLEFVEIYDFVNKDRMDYFLVFRKKAETAAGK